MKSDAMPMVENMAPNSVPVQCLVWNQYAPIVNNQLPQIKNWKKFITVKRSLMFIVSILKVGEIFRLKNIKSSGNKKYSLKKNIKIMGNLKR
jgi:di/tricarboxylate transporter